MTPYHDEKKQDKIQIPGERAQMFKEIYRPQQRSEGYVPRYLSVPILVEIEKEEASLPQTWIRPQ